MQEREMPNAGDKVTSIIVCMTEGDRPYARQAILSAVNQTVPGPVFVYVSNDNTWIDDMVKGLPRVTVHRMDLAPLGTVRNAGVAAATTEYVAFLDGDDVWLPTKTERQLDLIERTGADLVGADHVLIRPDGVRFGYAMARNLPMPSAWLVRRSVMERYPFNTMIAEDGDWWLRTRGSIDRRRLPEVLIEYRVRPSSLSSSTRGKRRKELACRLGSLPVMREALLAGTWVAHQLTRRNDYIWHDRIGA